MRSNDLTMEDVAWVIAELLSGHDSHHRPRGGFIISTTKLMPCMYRSDIRKRQYATLMQLDALNDFQEAVEQKPAKEWFGRSIPSEGKVNLEWHVVPENCDEMNYDGYCVEGMPLIPYRPIEARCNVASKPKDGAIIHLAGKMSLMMNTDTFRVRGRDVHRVNRIKCGLLSEVPMTMALAYNRYRQYVDEELRKNTNDVLLSIINLVRAAMGKLLLTRPTNSVDWTGVKETPMTPAAEWIQGDNFVIPMFVHHRRTSENLDVYTVRNGVRVRSVKSQGKDKPNTVHFTIAAMDKYDEENLRVRGPDVWWKTFLGGWDNVFQHKEKRRIAKSREEKDKKKRPREEDSAVAMTAYDKHIVDIALFPLEREEVVFKVHMDMESESWWPLSSVRQQLLESWAEEKEDDIRSLPVQPVVIVYPTYCLCSSSHNERLAVRNGWDVFNMAAEAFALNGNSGAYRRLLDISSLFDTVPCIQSKRAVADGTKVISLIAGMMAENHELEGMMVARWAMQVGVGKEQLANLLFLVKAMVMVQRNGDYISKHFIGDWQTETLGTDDAEQRVRQDRITKSYGKMLSIPSSISRNGQDFLRTVSIDHAVYPPGNLVFTPAPAVRGCPVYMMSMDPMVRFISSIRKLKTTGEECVQVQHIQWRDNIFQRSVAPSHAKIQSPMNWALTIMRNAFAAVDIEESTVCFGSEDERQYIHQYEEGQLSNLPVVHRPCRVLMEQEVICLSEHNSVRTIVLGIIQGVINEMGYRELEPHPAVKAFIINHFPKAQRERILRGAEEWSKEEVVQLVSTRILPCDYTMRLIHSLAITPGIETNGQVNTALTYYVKNVGEPYELALNFGEREANLRLDEDEDVQRVLFAGHEMREPCQSCVNEVGRLYQTVDGLLEKLQMQALRDGRSIKNPTSLFPRGVKCQIVDKGSATFWEARMIPDQGFIVMQLAGDVCQFQQEVTIYSGGSSSERPEYKVIAKFRAAMVWNVRNISDTEGHWKLLNTVSMESLVGQRVYGIYALGRMERV